MEKEEWRIIPGYEDYQASSAGRIRNNNGKILRPHLNKARPGNRYYVVNLMAPKKSGLGWKQRIKLLKVHRLVLLAFSGAPKPGQIGCHKNDVKTENHIDNLYWGTYESNALDSIRMGTFNFPHPGLGEKHHSAKYSDELIDQIRKEYTGKWGEQTILSRKYGIPLGYLNTLLNHRMRRSA